MRIHIVSSTSWPRLSASVRVSHRTLGPNTWADDGTEICAETSPPMGPSCYNRDMHAGGRENLVDLAPDHPGFLDGDYRRRRNEIAALALDYVESAPVPLVDYTDVEHGVWKEIWAHLAPLHETRACGAYKKGAAALALAHDRIPQLRDIDDGISRAVGFRFLPVAGLVTAHTFLTYLARRVFLSTQYMRHHSRPLYTPEPDIVHEIVGHAATFLHPAFVSLNLQFGQATLEESDAAEAERIARIYWYTLEFGVVVEHGKHMVYGAGLLSSFGELERFEREAELRPLDLDQMAATPYDPTDYQRVLYVADDLESLPARFAAWRAARPSRVSR